MTTVPRTPISVRSQYSLTATVAFVIVARANRDSMCIAPVPPCRGHFDPLKAPAAARPGQAQPQRADAGLRHRGRFPCSHGCANSPATRPIDVGAAWARRLEARSHWQRPARADRGVGRRAGNAGARTGRPRVQLKCVHQRHGTAIGGGSTAMESVSLTPEWTMRLVSVNLPGARRRTRVAVWSCCPSGPARRQRTRCRLGRTRDRPPGPARTARSARLPPGRRPDRSRRSRSADACPGSIAPPSTCCWTLPARGTWPPRRLLGRRRGSSVWTPATARCHPSPYSGSDPSRCTPGSTCTSASHRPRGR